MKSRFSSLVKLKKSAMQKSEKELQTANTNLVNALSALELSYKNIDTIKSPLNGSIGELQASRTLISSAREIIEHNREWVEFAQNQVNQAKEKLKFDMIEYEKFKHLELKEIQEELKRLKKEESKNLDEVALITFGKKVVG